jgi:hypothetical protein
MATRTINAKTDLTYEEIYEGYHNGKSRLPKILKDIESGTGAFAVLANASTGVNVLRRRTGGGNATDVSGIGISVTNTVAQIVSKAYYDTLLAAYSPLGGEPSQNFIDADVRGVVKNPFDLIDFVSGIDNSDQFKGSGNALATRAAKMKAQGSNVVIRDFTEYIASDTAAGYDMRAKFGDRVGGGGATGEVHGVDQGIADLIATDGQAIAIGATAATGYGLAGATALTLDVDNQGNETVTYTASILQLGEVIQETNAQITTGKAGVAGTDQFAVRSEGLGADGEVDVTGANAVLALAPTTAVGATVGASSLASDDTAIVLGASGVDMNIRYGTYQFGTLRIFTSINDAEPVAYILHPDLLDDLIVGVA